MISVPNGIVLVTGATGSGKSTTTYSILQTLNKKEVNIITVEDPVEMNIEGINQVQVNSEIGLDFATVLRSILRQDPNIILIGEIRDSETAKIAVRASITGHFVLSTIHTNNSLSTIERLLDMDVERYLLSTALTGIISQRLAKMLCPKCRTKRPTTNYEKKIFKNVLGKDIVDVYDANHNGCSECHNGYKGRIAVQEVLEIDDDIRLALNNEKLKKEELRSLVYTSNVITLLQDGLLKVLDGTTSFEEIYRIIEIDSDDNDNYGAEMAKVEEEQKEKQQQEEITAQTNSNVTSTTQSVLTTPQEELPVQENTVTAEVKDETQPTITETVSSDTTPQITATESVSQPQIVSSTAATTAAPVIVSETRSVINDTQPKISEPTLIELPKVEVNIEKETPKDVIQTPIVTDTVPIDTNKVEDTNQETENTSTTEITESDKMDISIPNIEIPAIVT